MDLHHKKPTEPRPGCVFYDTEERLVRRFMRDLIVDETHKKDLKKFGLIEWAGSYWRLTDKGQEIAGQLGL